jgi:hypothetical protein
MSHKTRKAYTAEEKVTILRRHLIDHVPRSSLPNGSASWRPRVNSGANAGLPNRETSRRSRLARLSPRYRSLLHGPLASLGVRAIILGSFAGTTPWFFNPAGNLNL